MDLTYPQVRDLFTKIARNGMTDYSKRTLPARRQVVVIKVDEATGMKAELAALTHEMNMLRAERQEKPVIICGLCEGEHYTDQCHMAP